MKKRHCFVWWRRGLPCPVTRRTESGREDQELPEEHKQRVFKQKEGSLDQSVRADSRAIRSAAVGAQVYTPLDDAIGQPLAIPQEQAPATVPQIIANLQSLIAEPMPLIYSKGASDALEQFYGKDIQETWSIQEQKALSSPWMGSESGYLPSNMMQQSLSNRLGAVNEFGLGSQLMKGSLLSGLGLSPWEALTMSELASSKSVGQLLQNLEPSLNNFLSTMNNAVNSNITMGATSQILQNLPANKLPFSTRLEDYLQELQEDPRAVEFFKAHGTTGLKLAPGQLPVQQKPIPKPIPNIYNWSLKPPKGVKKPIKFPKPKSKAPKFKGYPPMIQPWDKIAMRQNYKSEIGKMLGRGWSNKLFLTNEEQRKRRKKYGAQSAAAGWWKHAHTGDSGPTGTYGAGDWFSSLHS